MSSIVERLDRETHATHHPQAADDPGTAGNQPVKRGSTKKNWNTMMKLVRRIHLYSGLFMFPWVLLYGVTGMFFNHPRWFTGGEVRTFAASSVVGGKLTQLPPPQTVAQTVVAAINETTAQTNGPNVVLTDLRSPQYDRTFTFTVHTDEADHTVTVNPVTGDGEIRTFAIDPEEEQARTQPNPLEGIRRVHVQSHSMTFAQAAVPKVLEDLGLPSAQANTGRRSPNLVFSANVDGEPVALSYNLGNGSLSTTPENAKSTMTAKSFMQRLHLSRGYSPHPNIDSVWAILVDAMFLSMVFWGLSGILLWWQLKRTRWLGGGFLVASLVVTVFLVAGMHDSLTVAGSRGRGGDGDGLGVSDRGGPGREASHGSRGGHGGLMDGPGHNQNSDELPRGRFGGRGGFGRGRGFGGAGERGDGFLQEGEGRLQGRGRFGGHP